MSATIPIRTDYTAAALRQFAKRSKCSRQS
ncbi:hypothetical protein MNBD_ALPHA09-325, partial [hydrothermal vent metagenome]